MRRENIGMKDIDICNGVATADEITNTCKICVALNRTVFKNNNKPDYEHPFCKCKQVPTTLQKVELDFPAEKINQYLLVKKLKLMQSMGYEFEDAEEIYQMIAKNAKEKFMNGEYDLGELNRYGQKVNIAICLFGKKAKSGRKYNFITAWTAYPNGKLHNNTPFARWAD